MIYLGRKLEGVWVLLRECEGKCCGRGRVVRVREISGAEMSNYQRIGDLIFLISLAKNRKEQPSRIFI